MVLVLSRTMYSKAVHYSHKKVIRGNMTARTRLVLFPSTWSAASFMYVHNTRPWPFYGAFTEAKSRAYHTVAHDFFFFYSFFLSNVIYPAGRPYWPGTYSR